MLTPLGYHPTSSNMFMAVMSGYFANIIFPRMGEVTRCGLLQKTSKVPAKISFGAVITERIIDLIVFGFLTTLMLVLEFDQISDFLFGTLQSSADTLTEKLTILGLIALSGCILIALAIFNRHKLRRLPFYEKVVNFIKGLADGVTSIRKMNKTSQVWYVAHTINIWAMYYLMSYLLFFASDVTEHLSLGAGLSATMMGGLGMIVPTPGGTGSYHLFVTNTLMAYGLIEANASSFAFLMHSTQTLSILFFGGLSILIANIISRRDSFQETKDEQQVTQNI